MKGKVYLTTFRIAIVLDIGRMWAVPWNQIANVAVKKHLMAATAHIQPVEGAEFGVDSTKGIVRDIDLVWKHRAAAG